MTRRACPAARRRSLVLAAALACLAATSSAPGARAADAPPPAAIETPHRDPYLPPQSQPARPAEAKRGAALQAQAEGELAAAFAAADTSHKGTLTRDEARKAGLGYVAKHFDDIDTARRGAVSFDDLVRYLDRRRAAAAGRPR
jgi:hypothetical protein